MKSTVKKDVTRTSKVVRIEGNKEIIHVMVEGVKVGEQIRTVKSWK
jgi:hypothetical protein